MVQFSGGSVTIRGGILYFSRARAREGFGDISGILAVFGGGRAAADDFAIFEKGLFLRGSKRFRYHYICLLYTSPSPRDATLSRMPSSA